MMRPDFDVNIHQKVLQAGFALDLEEKTVPQANNYEEIKEAANSDSEDSENATVTTVEGTNVSVSAAS